jgi:dCMP deaminase
MDMTIEEYMRILHNTLYYAAQSPSRSKQVGCIIYDVFSGGTIATGFNAPIRGVSLDNQDSFLMEHAERNTIYDAARKGCSLHCKGMAVSYYPCAECARAIVQSGIIEIVSFIPDWNDPRWGESWKAAKHILNSANVNVLLVSGRGKDDIR